jgi:hypothetical protein
MMPPGGGYSNYPPPGGFAPNYQAAPGGAYPNYQPPANNTPNFQGPPPAPLPAGPSVPMTGALSYPPGLQAASYQGFAPAPWLQPAVYPPYWNMPSPYGR